jgi:dTDP-glucose pyrophosphorylase
MKKIVAVILAAGRGTRMHPFSNYYPKPGLPVCNKPVIQYSIEAFRKLGIEDIFIVIGHLGHELAQALGNGEALGVRIRYVEQTKILGIAAALGQLEPYISTPMFVVLGDIFFKADNLASMMDVMARSSAGAVLAVKRERDPAAIRRNFTVLHDEAGRVRRVIEKPRHVPTDVKGCGLYLFDLPVFDAVRRTPRTAMRDEYEITDTIQIMVDDGLPVFTADVVKWDVNLTVPADVLTCNLFQLQQLGTDRLIGRDARIHHNAKMRNVVIGDRAIVRYPVSISNSVIFPDTQVTAEDGFDRFIVTPEAQIDCRTFALNAGD